MDIKWTKAELGDEIYKSSMAFLFPITFMDWIWNPRLTVEFVIFWINFPIGFFVIAQSVGLEKAAFHSKASLIRIKAIFFKVPHFRNDLSHSFFILTRKLSLSTITWKKSHGRSLFIRLEISKKEGKIKYSTESIIFRESFLKLDVYS